MKLPQLTLRDLFWLVLVVAILCWRWIDHASVTQRRSELDKQREALEAEYANKNATLSELFKRLEEIHYGKKYPKPIVPPPVPPLMPYELPKNSDDVL